MILDQTVVLVNIALMLSQVVWAQKQNAYSAKAFFEQDSLCAPAHAGKKCIVLDIRQSVDKEGKEFVYRWRLGEGTVKEGLLIEHCYSHYGVYSIVLDIVDKQNNIVIENEFFKTITLIPPVNYATDTVYQGFNVKFAYDERQIPDCLIEGVFWKIENQFYSGTRLNYVFKNKGIREIEVGMIGRVEGEEIRGCKLMSVLVK